MAAFDAAGIYVRSIAGYGKKQELPTDTERLQAFIDLDTFNTTVVETAPAWTQEQFQAYAMVMDVFSKYDNVAGKFIISIISSALWTYA